MSKDNDDELINDDELEFSTDDDDDENVDITIEISDENDDSEEDDDVVLSKHKQHGKHSLKYDSIFKGKKRRRSC